MHGRTRPAPTTAAGGRSTRCRRSRRARRRLPARAAPRAGIARGSRSESTWSATYAAATPPQRDLPFELLAGRRLWLLARRRLWLRAGRRVELLARRRLELLVRRRRVVFAWRRLELIARRAADDVLELPAPALPALAPHLRLLQLVRLVGVAPARPARVRVREPDRPDPPNERDEQREQGHEVLRLGQQDRHDQQIEDHQRDDHLDRSLRKRDRPDDDEAGEGGGDHDGLARFPPLLGPVDVLEPQPQGELVERESGADAEEHGEDLRPRRHVLGAEAEEAAEQEQDDAPHQVMDVQVTRRHAARPPRHLGAAHEPCASADKEERTEEAGEEPECKGAGGGVGGGEDESGHSRGADANRISSRKVRDDPGPAPDPSLTCSRARGTAFRQ